jgi:hypothetical protein
VAERVEFETTTLTSAAVLHQSHSQHAIISLLACYSRLSERPGLTDDLTDHGIILASIVGWQAALGQWEQAVGRVEWIKLESEEESAQVLRWRVCEGHSDQTRRESIAKAAMDDMWEFPATGPERKLGALFADGIRFLDENRQVVWQLTYQDVWKQRRSN